MDRNFIHNLFFSQDRNKIVLTVNHKEDSQQSRKSIASNQTILSSKSNKASDNGPYATLKTTSNGSPDKVCCKFPYPIPNPNST